jgi:alpha-L-arabinofuranosidase
MARSLSRLLGRPVAPRVHLHLERLDDRVVPTVVANAIISSNAIAGGLGVLDDAVRGVNITTGEDRAVLNDPIILQRAREAGVRLYRIPGGSTSDAIHFDMQNPNGPSSLQRSKSNWMDLMKFAEATGGRKLVTLNYGTGSPQEAAAWVAYMNGVNKADTTALGWGQYWTIKPGQDIGSTNPADRTSIWKDWKTVGFWVSLRSQTPIAQDDGLNFLRVGRTQPFNTEFVEVGNEVFGNWEPNARSPWATNPAVYLPGDYIWFAKTFTGLIRNMQLSVQPKVGIVVDADNNETNFPGTPFYQNWDALVLGECAPAKQNFQPDFLVDHPYAYVPDPRTDAALLSKTSTDTTPGNLNNWVNRTQYFRNLAQKQGVPGAANLKIMATEFGSTGSFPLSNQTTNLPNGLWLADSLGQGLNAGYSALAPWTFTSDYSDPGTATTRTEYNGWQAGSTWFYSDRYDPSLYGWRKGLTAWGMVGNGRVNLNNGPQQYATEIDTTQPGARNFKPATGRGVPYPTYFAGQLFSQLVHSGDTTLVATDDNPDLSVYAVRQSADKHIRLMVVNKSPTNDVYAYFNLKNFQVNAAAGVKVWRYDIANDNAQRDSTDGNSSLYQWTQAPDSVTRSGADSTMPFWFSPYSMTVIDVAPTATTAAANRVTNAGFEADYNAATTNQYIGVPAGWNVAGNAYAQSGYGIAPHGGGVYGIHWGSGNYTAESSQQLTGLANGTYTLTAWVKSSGGQSSAVMFVNDGAGGASRTLALNTTTTDGWNGAWTQVTIPNVVVSNGKAKIGFASTAGANQWMLFDDVSFTQTA